MMSEWSWSPLVWSGSEHSPSKPKWPSWTSLWLHTDLDLREQEGSGSERLKKPDSDFRERRETAADDCRGDVKDGVGVFLSGPAGLWGGGGGRSGLKD